MRCSARGMKITANKPPPKEVYACEETQTVPVNTRTREDHMVTESVTLNQTTNFRPLVEILYF